jgi:hypothetical protein
MYESIFNAKCFFVSKKLWKHQKVYEAWKFISTKGKTVFRSIKAIQLSKEDINRNEQATTRLEFHVPLTNCVVDVWFCVVHGPKLPLHRHNWLSFGKFQDTERFLIPCPHHVPSRLPPSGETCKYATAPCTQKNLRNSLPIDMLPFGVNFPATVPQGRKSLRDLWIPLYSCENLVQLWVSQLRNNSRPVEANWPFTSSNSILWNVSRNIKTGDSYCI